MAKGSLDMIRDLAQRAAGVDVKLQVIEKTTEDHESRLRKLEYLTAKVAGAALAGSAVGGWLLSQVSGCV